MKYHLKEASHMDAVVDIPWPLFFPFSKIDWRVCSWDRTHDELIKVLEKYYPYLTPFRVAMERELNYLGENLRQFYFRVPDRRIIVH